MRAIAVKNIHLMCCVLRESKTGIVTFRKINKEDGVARNVADNTHKTAVPKPGSGTQQSKNSAPISEDRMKAATENVR